MSTPVIGIAGAGYVVPRFWGELAVHGVPTTYVDAIAAAGGRPLILPPGYGVDLLELVDGLVLAGGDDIGVDPVRDRAETALVHAARDREVPLLGVCRGLQLLTVADGGSLVPELALTHVLPQVGHAVASVPGSLVAQLLSESLTVSSLHHQAPDSLGAGWAATACADDGVVEAAEWLGSWPALGVQWHPELDTTGPALFGWLVERAAAGLRNFV